MNYSGAMINSTSYPHQDNYMNMQPQYYQQQNYPIYRPAYHRIPSTPTVSNLNKDAWASTELAPVVVPSMSPSILKSQYMNHHSYMNQGNPYFYRQNQALPSDNAPMFNEVQAETIVEPDLQKELVKDVFFSPAMITSVREMSPSVYSSSSCDFESDQSFDEAFSPNETDLLFEDPLFDLVQLDEAKKKSSYTSLDSPTADYQPNKRRLSTSLSQLCTKKRMISPPGSPDFDYNDDSDTSSSNTDSEFEPPLAESSFHFWEQEVASSKKKSKKVVQKEVLLPKAPARPTAYPTIYQKLTKANIDWCRYCGTTEGVNWRPGPWGKRTLCNKHGCDYKGYGFACKLPRLDLTGFLKETIHDRDRPVLQLFCSGCQRKESWEGNVLVRCEGCPKAYHQQCCPTELDHEFVASNESWFCNEECCENSRKKRIVVELPRKRLPLMRAPTKNNSLNAANDHASRLRSLRDAALIR